MQYDVTLITIRPATAGKAMAKLAETAPAAPGKLLACWQSEIGNLNQILLIREHASAQAAADYRQGIVESEDPYGVGEWTNSSESDTYAVLPFLKPLQPGTYGPFFEVRTYLLKPGKAASTIERWKEALPARLERSPLLTCMNSVSGRQTRFLHIWPYPSLDKRYEVRQGAIKDGIWPPKGGGENTLWDQRSDIYVPAPFSPIK
ncbi:hypothetical protein GJW-30_1_00197 [Variibacter gotjawalensis]|uniref:NIPSNAP domain-containing protein n=1 Tax=Variibacter gotjawalensis TaxID=1333996 RepID=A0A0S3PP40_9BRAD|nr:NIPSNAP family protein [Variibacter gotjawalensis]NIK47983.1 hypothetical protein [Variibacter gotjawalensis]RZS49860.1 NIPSNAP protein [Variibacter gotjawalensis]BAT57689.1 hypothetical protein GJW-30_1_00197 [Variibacter gotjawalensis]